MSSWWSQSKSESNKNIEADDASAWSNPFTKVASNQSVHTLSGQSEAGASSWANPFRDPSRENASSNTGTGTSFKSKVSNTLGGGSGSNWINVDSEGLAYARGELTGENSEFKRWGFDLTRQQRIVGFVGCVIGGFCLCLIGSILLIFGGVIPFVVFYCVGFLTSLIGTGFLIGFARQLRLMFKPERAAATSLMIAAFIMVWISAFVINISYLALIFCILLYVCYLWYALSYIPGARGAIKSFFARVF